MQKCLIFEVWGEWAHFRKIYTTSSPLTYSIPPRTAIAGLTAAIIGISKEQYYDFFTKDQALIGIRIMNPIKKFRIGLNLVNTKTAKMFARVKDRTQVRQELVKKPRYRIYFSHCDSKLYEKLHTLLINGQSYFTPYLGLSEYIAQIDYVGEFDIQEKASMGESLINSVVPIPTRFPINLEGEDRGEYFKEILPGDFEKGNQRIVREYAKVLFERQGKPIKCEPPKYWEVSNGENILFL